MHFRIFDSHCHLQDRKFKGQIEKVIKNAQEAGVIKILVPGWDINSSIEAIKISEKFENVYAACGIHPHDAKSYTENIDKKIIKLIKDKTVVAVGEIGLDYYRNLSPKKNQRETFKRQLEIAEDFDIPVIIHARDSIEETIDIVSDFNCRGVFHAFDYRKAIAMKIIDMGFYIGIGGVITYPKNKISKAIKELSLDHLLIETDAPYLTPNPNRGKVNEPAYTTHVVEKIAEIKSNNFRDVANKTYANTKELFSI